MIRVSSPGAQPFLGFDAELLCNGFHKQEQREDGGQEKDEAGLEQAEGLIQVQTKSKLIFDIFHL